MCSIVKIMKSSINLTDGSILKNCFCWDSFSRLRRNSFGMLFPATKINIRIVGYAYY